MLSYVGKLPRRVLSTKCDAIGWHWNSTSS